MLDQAAGLRSLFARRRPSLLIVAGADPGKAAVAVHFAREAAACQRATVLIDGTAGQAAAACGLACRYELAHVLAGDKTFDDVVQVLTSHLLLLPAARALSHPRPFTADEEARLADALGDGIAKALSAAGAIEPQVDLIVVNAGEAVRAVEAFGRDARVVIVASDRPASLCAAFVDMKALVQRQGFETFEIAVPRCDDGTPSGVPLCCNDGMPSGVALCCDDGMLPGIAFTNLARAARRFLGIELIDGGTVRLPAHRAPAGHARSAFARRPPIADPDAALAAASNSDCSFTYNDEVHHAAAVA